MCRNGEIEVFIRTFVWAIHVTFSDIDLYDMYVVIFEWLSGAAQVRRNRVIEVDHISVIVNMCDR